MYAHLVKLSHFQLFLLGLVNGWTFLIIVGITVGIPLGVIWWNNGSGEKGDNYKACHLSTDQYCVGEGSTQNGI